MRKKTSGDEAGNEMKIKRSKRRQEKEEIKAEELGNKT